MSKFFVKRHRLNDYIITEEIQTRNVTLEYLYSALAEEYEWIHVTHKEDQLLIWSSWYIKPKNIHNFFSKEQQIHYDMLYGIYYHKRWNDMPKLEITCKNWEKIIKKWQMLKKQKASYIIFSQNVYGLVDLIGKEALSDQDMIDIKIEYEKNLKDLDAYNRYMQAHPKRSDVWRSPADSEYEANWQKYLNQDC